MKKTFLIIILTLCCRLVIIAQEFEISETAQKYIDRAEMAMSMVKEPKDYQKVIDELKKALVEIPNNQNIIFNLGICYDAMGILDVNNYTKAIGYYKAFLELNPSEEDMKDIVNRINKSECAIEEGKRQQIQCQLEIIAQKLEISETTKIYVERARMAMSKVKEPKDYQKVIDELKKALIEAPNNQNIIFNLGICYDGMGVLDISNYTRAIEYYKQFLAFNPNEEDKKNVNNRIKYAIAKIEPEMIFVQGGTFEMGGCYDSKHWCDDIRNEYPSHNVTLSNFYIGKYAITQAQWKAIMGYKKTSNIFKGDNLPIDNVSWEEANEYIRKLSDITDKKYRLPTEAEWEYAARGGNKSRGYIYSGSNNHNDVIGTWYLDGCTVYDIGTRQPNELGIYDMSGGNGYVWCSDWYDEKYYNASPPTDPTGPSSGFRKVIRGGDTRREPCDLRVSWRRGADPNSSGGFRVVQSIEHNFQPYLGNWKYSISEYSYEDDYNIEFIVKNNKLKVKYISKYHWYWDSKTIFPDEYKTADVFFTENGIQFTISIFYKGYYKQDGEVYEEREVGRTQEITYNLYISNDRLEGTYIKDFFYLIVQKAGKKAIRRGERIGDYKYKTISEAVRKRKKTLLYYAEPKFGEVFLERRQTN